MIMSIPGIGTEDEAKIVKYVFYAVIPHFCFGYGLLEMVNNYMNKDTCSNIAKGNIEQYCIDQKASNIRHACCKGSNKNHSFCSLLCNQNIVFKLFILFIIIYLFIYLIFFFAKLFSFLNKFPLLPVSHHP